MGRFLIPKLAEMGVGGRERWGAIACVVVDTAQMYWRVVGRDPQHQPGQHPVDFSPFIRAFAPSADDTFMSVMLTYARHAWNASSCGKDILLRMRQDWSRKHYVDMAYVQMYKGI
jgi:hypothetical protein